MNKSKLPRPLRSIIPPMIIPLIHMDTLDSAGLEKLIEHILSGAYGKKVELNEN